MDILKLINPKDLLDFSQNFAINRNYLGDQLFPDVKSQNIKAEFYRLSDQRLLPTMAQVHAFDTEAHIGQRPTMEKVTLEKMLIKEKINQTEKVQLFLENGGDTNSIVQYVFDDVARLSESVKTRTEVMKCEVLTTGKVTVKENGLQLTVDYGVPSANKSTASFASASDDILGTIQAIVDNAKNAGYTLTRIITSNKIVSYMRKNTAIQTAIFGAVGQGTFVSLDRINALFMELFGLTVVTYDERYQYEKANGTLSAKRYFDENTMTLVATRADGSLGRGLWGVTPEEAAASPWSAKSMKQYITACMWNTPDPVATWTKASGLFVPVVPDAKGIYIVTVS